MIERIIGVVYSAIRGVQSNRILGRVSSGTGGVEQLTPEQVRNLITVNPSPIHYSAIQPKTWSNDVSWTSVFNTTASEYAGSLNFTPVIGDTYRIRVWGKLSGDATSTPVWSFRTLLAGVDTGQTIMTGSGEINDADNEFMYECHFTVEDDSASSQNSDVATLRYHHASGDSYSMDQNLKTGLNFSAQTTIDVEAKMSVAHANNSIDILSATIEHIPAP